MKQSTEQSEGTDNQKDRDTQWGTLGHCQLYIQWAQTTSQTGAHWGTYCLLYIQRAQITSQIGDTHSGAL